MRIQMKVSLRKTAFALALSGLSLLFTSCSKPVEEKPVEHSITVHLVHPPELRSYMSAMKEQFYLSNPVLSDGNRIKIELTSSPSLLAAEQIASGEIKPEAWIPPSDSVRAFSEDHIKNLGAPMRSCRVLFSSPVVLAVSRRHLPTLGITDQTASWKALAERGFDAHGGVTGEDATVSLSHGTPRLSTTGLASLTWLMQIASGAGTAAMEDPMSPAPLSRLQEFESLVSGYGLSEHYLLARTASREARRIRLTITTEQQLALFNTTVGADLIEEQRLVAVYPTEGVTSEKYQLCQSEADWVSPSLKSAIQKFAEFLASSGPQREAARAGFRPEIVAVDDVASLTAKYGIATNVKLQPLPPISGVQVEQLLKRWGSIMRPAAVGILLDCSGSMEGERLRTAKEHFRNLLARLGERDLTSLVSFSTQAKVDSAFTGDRGLIMSRLDALQSQGGSSIYDGLRASIELMTSQDLKKYRKTIVLLTDGDDKNSETSLTSLTDTISDKFSRYDINLMVLAISSEGASYKDLKQIANAANGLYREAPSDRLSSIFQEALDNLQGSIER